MPKSFSEVNAVNIEQPQRGAYQEDEISLVDLAVILIRRWKTMAVIFFVVTVISIAAAFLLPNSYKYVSFYSVAEYTSKNGQRVGVESPDSAVAKTLNLYLGQETSKLLEEHELESLPFNVNVSNPSDTLILQFDSVAEEKYQPLVNELHKMIINSLQQDQSQLVERRRSSLERQLASDQQALESAQQSDSSYAGELIATYHSRISDIEGELNDLQEGEVTQYAVQSQEDIGASKVMIVAIGIVVGGVLAIIGAFLIQFAMIVSQTAKLTKP